MRSEEELFGPDGNFEDYWLGYNGRKSGTNTRLWDNEDWVAIESVLQKIRTWESHEWTPNRDMIRKILGDRPNAVDRAGGILDISPEFHHVRSRLLGRGRLALEFEREESR